MDDMSLPEASQVIPDLELHERLSHFGEAGNLKVAVLGSFCCHKHNVFSSVSDWKLPC